MSVIIRMKFRVLGFQSVPQPAINQQRLERPRYLSTDQPHTQSRSLLSRSRVNRAVEAARRVGGGLIVAALNVGGLRSGAGAPTDASG